MEVECRDTRVASRTSNRRIAMPSATRCSPTTPGRWRQPWIPLPLPRIPARTRRDPTATNPRRRRFLFPSLSTSTFPWTARGARRCCWRRGAAASRCCGSACAAARTRTAAGRTAARRSCWPCTRAAWSACVRSSAPVRTGAWPPPSGRPRWRRPEGGPTTRNSWSCCCGGRIRR
jgi:hypothetical protein